MTVTSNGIVFVAYAHKDARKHLDDLQAAIPTAMVKAGTWRPWSDQEIRAGEDWKQELDAAFSRTRICVLLLTMGFLKSEYITSKELPQILRAREKQGMRIVPVLCDPCMWDYPGSPLKKYQFANEKPVSKLRGAANKKEEWVRIAKLVQSYWEEVEESSSASDGPVFDDYELHHTIYGNGYTMSHRKLEVTVDRRCVITHTFHHLPSDDGQKRGFKLPTFERLDANAGLEVPYPQKAFFAFSSGHQNVAPIIWDPRRSGPVRNFEVSLPRKGTYKYQWMWGAPYGFPRESPSWQVLQLNDRRIKRLKVKLRLRHTVERPIDPCWCFVEPNVAVDLAQGRSLNELLMHSRPIYQNPSEHTPLFRCYDYVLGGKEISRGKDIVLVY